MLHFPDFSDYEAITCKGDGSTAKARLGDFVWYDSNENGIQDPNEMGVPGVSIRLFDAQQNSLASTQTDTNGHYQFNNLTPGNYKLLFDPNSLQQGYVISPKDQGGNDAKDSDANAQGWVTSITLPAGVNNTTVDMGIYRKLTCRSGFHLYRNDSNSHRGVHMYDGGLTHLEITSTFGNTLHNPSKVDFSLQQFSGSMHRW
ncbi:MAG: hypothetical protein DSY99_05505 [Candidatus Neomarinimicrobiota bacterium]|nr:MAG: hypothetical protein DSY99_05505 [Candidatus Neomarinimicrobiota bacterium]